MNNIPTIHQLRKSGLKVKVLHLRRCKQVELCWGKIIQRETMLSNYFANSMNHGYRFIEILPKGGNTCITIIDPVSNSEFSARTTCRKDEAFVKSIGINNCLTQLHAMMTSIDGIDGFNYKFNAENNMAEVSN